MDGIRIHSETAVTTAVIRKGHLFELFGDEKRQVNHKQKRLLDASGRVGKRSSYFGFYRTTALRDQWPRAEKSFVAIFSK